jgi:hypothetical protein
MATDRFCLKIEIMPDGLRLRYMQVFSGSIIIYFYYFIQPF